MGYVIRNKSIITGKENLEPLYTMKDFPVFFGCIDNNKEGDLRADMSWAICPETGVIQLDKLIPLEILYQEQHVDGTGPTWQKYYQDFVDYIIKQNANSILEIGGGKGTLADIFIGKTKDTIWTMVEPNPLHEGGDRIKIISKFFDGNFNYNDKVDAVVFSQVLEHAYDPQEFMGNIKNFLKPGGRLIFAYPNLKLWLEKKYTNAINFEHTMFLTDYFVDYILAQQGFKILDKTFYDEHSIFYTVESLESPEELPKFENKYVEYKKIFMDFINYHLEIVEELNKKVDETTEPVYLFGAHIFSQYLIQFGLKTDKIVYILDNSPLKQNKRLYGSNLIVKFPKMLSDKGSVNIVLKAGIYNDEIKKDILENINSKVNFW